MNLKALFLAVALSLPFAAAATTVSSVASADPLPAAQAGAPAQNEHHVAEGKRGEHAKGDRAKAAHARGHHAKGGQRRGEHRKGEHGKGARRTRGEHGKGERGKGGREHGPRGDGGGRPQRGSAKR